MKKGFVLLIVAASLMFGCSPASAPLPPLQASPEQRQSILVGKVIKVVDGDTIDIVDSRSKHRIRLKGIDAPERNQAFGLESARSLARMTTGKKVVVEWKKVDEYDRLVGRVLVDEQDVCLKQIRAGMAWHFKRYQDEQSDQERKLYDRAENEARSSRRGLWTDSKPIEPWVVRAQQRSFPSEISKDQSHTPVPSPPAQNEGRDEGIRGNRRSMIYHWPGCPNYDDIAMHNRVSFTSRAEAERAGYRAARNCR